MADRRHFAEQDVRLLVVGKPHRGGDDQPGEVGDPIDLSKMAETQLRHESWPYWRYTVELADRVHGAGKGWERVAMTNIVKCTNVFAHEKGAWADTTGSQMTANCVSELGVIADEIRLLRATHVVFYTAVEPFGSSLKALKPGKLISESKERRACGKSTMPFWARTYETDWGLCRALVTRHPQMAHKADFIKTIEDWVKGK